MSDRATDERVRKSLEHATGLPVRITKWVALQPDGHERVLSEKHEIIERSAPEPPADLLSTCTARAAQWLARAIEGGVTPEEVAKLSEEFARQAGEMVAKRIVAMNPDAFEPVVRGAANVGADEEQENGRGFKKPEPAPMDLTEPEDPTADPELAGTPRKKRQADPDDPNPTLPHLDEPRNKKLAETMGSPVIESGTSKSLVRILRSSGYESIGVDEQGIEHLIHSNWKSEAMVHPTDGFAIRSGFDGSVSAGESSDDLLAALDNQ